MTSQDSADPSDRPQDLWARLYRYYVDGSPTIPPGANHYYPSVYDDNPLDFPPATEEQVRTTEERLGYPLPLELRRIYIEFANGGLVVGPFVLYGAAGGCGANPLNQMDGPTIEDLASANAWQLHPQIEEALLCHLGRYVIVDS